jgi:hypothetical protein
VINAVPVACPRCRVVVRSDRLEKHYRKVHGVEDAAVVAREISALVRIIKRRIAVRHGDDPVTQAPKKKIVASNVLPSPIPKPTPRGKAFVGQPGRCTQCGAPAILGDYVCYRCNPK